jgi:hypothetical protein
MNRYPPRARKIIAPPSRDPNALYVVEIAPGEHSAPMSWDDAMNEWKVACAMVPGATVRPWEFVKEEDERRKEEATK